MKKVGTVALIGRPNVGKSSLLNAILNYKVSIISATPQTTRDEIRGIYTDKDLQIVFLDTPGIHKPQSLLSDSLNKKAFRTIKDTDLNLLLIPSNQKIGPGDKFIFEKIKKDNICVITKVDIAIPEIMEYNINFLKQNGIKNILDFDIKDSHKISKLVNAIENELPNGEFLYPLDYVTDKSIRFMAKEFIRETVITHTREEIPHSIGVIIEEYIESKKDDEPDRIKANIFVERDSQKGIIIGAKGTMIKKIGIMSREKISKMINKKCHLFLNVLVKKNWTKINSEVEKMGY